MLTGGPSPTDSPLNEPAARNAGLRRWIGNQVMPHSKKKHRTANRRHSRPCCAKHLQAQRGRSGKRGCQIDEPRHEELRFETEVLLIRKSQEMRLHDTSLMSKRTQL